MASEWQGKSFLTDEELHSLEWVPQFVTSYKGSYSDTDSLKAFLSQHRALHLNALIGAASFTEAVKELAAAAEPPLLQLDTLVLCGKNEPWLSCLCHLALGFNADLVMIGRYFNFAESCNLSGGLSITMNNGEDAPQIAQLLSSNGRHLRRLELNKNLFNAEVAAAVGRMPWLESLILQVDADAFDAFVESSLTRIEQQQVNRLWDLSIGGNFRAESLQRLLSHPCVAKQLLSLWLDDDIPSSLSFQPCKSLQCLGFRTITDEQLAAINFQELPSLVSLSIGRNDGSDETETSSPALIAASSLASSNIKCLTVTDNTAHLAPILLNAHNKNNLRHIRFNSKRYDSEASIHAAAEVIGILDNDFTCKLETVKFVGPRFPKTYQQQAQQLIERNKMYREGGLAEEHLERASDARLFMCGDTGAGKTTISSNLVLGTVNAEDHPSTYGIQLQRLCFGEKRLLLCDLAGQPEFHTFHHYFVRGSNNDLFAIVCKAPSLYDCNDYLPRLRYWLRFIVAHRTFQSAQKPRVIIVFNFFSGQSEDSGITLDEQAFGYCERVVEEYSQYISFEKVLGLDARSTDCGRNGIYNLEEQLEKSLTGLLKKKRLLPRICKDIIAEIRRQQQQEEHPRVASVAECFNMFANLRTSQVNTQNLVEVSLRFLHDIGEVIYFPQHVFTKEERYVILDVQWFLREVIGEFLPRQSRDGEPQPAAPSRRRREMVKQLLRKHKCGKQHTQYLEESLSNMGVLLEDPQASNWIMVLPLIMDASPGWSDERSNEIYWGRRLECEDSAKTLLPSGIFARLQVNLASKFGKQAKVGRGWLRVFESDVTILVELGGDRAEWYDRQWVDILVKLPDEFRAFQDAEKLFLEVRQAVHEECNALNWGCPSLKLMEKVICPDSVRKLDRSRLETKSLDEVLEKAAAAGFMGKHSWEECTSKFAEITLLSEQDAYFCSKEQELRSIRMEYLGSLRGAHGKSASLPTSKKGNIDDLNSVRIELTKEIRMATEEIKHEVRETGRKILEAISTLEKSISKQLNVIQQQGKEIVELVFAQLEAVDYPRYVFVTEGEKKTLQKITGGKMVRVHALCEHGQTHYISEQKGISKRVPPQWLIKAAPVLVPVLRVIYFTGQVAATAYGVAIPSPLPLIQGLERKSFEKLVERTFEFAIEEGERQLSELLKTPQAATPSDVRGFWQMVIKDGVSLEDFDWKGKLGLVKTAGKFVCEECYSKHYSYRAIVV